MIDRGEDMRNLINRSFLGNSFANQGAEISADEQRPTAIREDADPVLVQKLTEKFARTALPEAIRHLLRDNEEFREAFTDDFLKYLNL